MEQRDLEQFDLSNDIRLLLSNIFKTRLKRLEIDKIETELNQLDKNAYNKIIQFIFETAEKEEYILNKTEASKGALGLGNKIGRFFKNIWFRYKYKDQGILVEGDSWFEHLFIKEIIDHLKEIVDIPIYSLASGGDWIGNYLQEQIYLQELLNRNYGFFLLSGGGNDLVGNGRISKMIKDRKDVSLEIDESFKQEVLPKLVKDYGEDKANLIALGRNFVNDDFWILRNIFFLEYLLIVRGIENEAKLSNLKIIVQGYDFAIPDNNNNNWFKKYLGNSTWLYKPISEKGYADSKEQKAIVAYMIHEFNEVLVYLTTHRKQVYFVDCRGVSKDTDWKDELHLCSEAYLTIAKTYKKCIESENRQDRIYLARTQNVDSSNNNTL